MGLDINLFRSKRGGNPDLIRESIKKRFQDPKIVDDVLTLDEQWRQLRYTLDQLLMERGTLNKAISEKKKKNKEDSCTVIIYVSNTMAEFLQEEIARRDDNIKRTAEVEKDEKFTLQELETLIRKIGNIVHGSVPVGESEAANEVVHTWGTTSNTQVTKGSDERIRANHYEIMNMIDGIEHERGVRVAGEGGYFLKGYGALLNIALYTYGVDFLIRKQYTLMQPPLFMKKNIMAETCQFADFDDRLYKANGVKGDEEVYLISTPEQPLSALYRGEWLDPKDLPIKFAGLSSCFRRNVENNSVEGFDMSTAHQYEQVEQFCITTPEASWKMHEEMLKTSEEFYQSLDLPYRIVSIASGTLNTAAVKTYDLEAWFPGYNGYKKMTSCSNCTDYQARALEIRCSAKKQVNKDKEYVHMLNATLCATDKTMNCILENYQTEEGVRVPEVLIPYIGVGFMPYVKDIPSNNG